MPPPAAGTPALTVTRADPAAVEAMLKAMQFDQMIGKMLNQQKQVVLSRIKSAFNMARTTATPAQELAEAETKTLDKAWVGMTPEAIHTEVARIYGEIFTTDEVHAITNFYNSPAGQAYIAKQPTVQIKVGAVLKSHLGQVEATINASTMKFSAEQHAKAKAAADAAAARARAEGLPLTTTISGD
jgi:hypothetical protein